jgi:glycine betaine/proline transport system ATP-binding protein
MSTANPTTVEFQNVDIIFGKEPKKALGLLDEGASRDEILKATDNVVGVADASLTIEEGEICVLMGLSGSGKSTLLRAVNGLNKVTRGKVLVRDGSDAASGLVDVASCDPATLRRLRMNRVAMVFQQFALLPWRTVSETVGLGLVLRGMSKAEREAIVEEKLSLVSLSQWKDKFAHELSGGMQQRVGLARAFATDADILLMTSPSRPSTR